MALDKPPNLNLHCLPSSLWILNMIWLGHNSFWKFVDINCVICFLALKVSNIYYNNFSMSLAFSHPERKIPNIWIKLVKFCCRMGFFPDLFWINAVAGSRSTVSSTSDSRARGPGFNIGSATYFCFSFRWFKKGSCQLLAKICAGSTG